MSESGNSYPLRDTEQKLVNLFRQHIDLFIGMETGLTEWLVDIALEDESGVTELLRLIKHDEEGDRQLITDLLFRIRSGNERNFKLFKQAVEEGVIAKQDNRSLSSLFLINGDIDNLKLFLSIFPLEIEKISDMYMYPMISMVFLVNLYPHIIPERIFSFGYTHSTKAVLRKIAEKLVSAGFTEIKSGNAYYTVKSKKYFKEILDQTDPSLFEIILRQCRRDEIDLSTLPLSLNCVNLDIVDLDDDDVAIISDDDGITVGGDI